SESSDRTLEVARAFGATVRGLPYEHGRIIPWIFDWALRELPIEGEWVLLLEADQALTPELRREIETLLASEPGFDGYYIRRRQFFRGREIRFGGYGSKRLLKLFRRGRARLDPDEQDTRVYVDGRVGFLRHALVESNAKEDDILF